MALCSSYVIYRTELLYSLKHKNLVWIAYLAIFQSFERGNDELKSIEIFFYMLYVISGGRLALSLFDFMTSKFFPHFEHLLPFFLLSSNFMLFQLLCVIEFLHTIKVFLSVKNLLPLLPSSSDMLNIGIISSYCDEIMPCRILTSSSDMLNIGIISSIRWDYANIQHVSHAWPSLTCSYQKIVQAKLTNTNRKFAYHSQTFFLNHQSFNSFYIIGSYLKRKIIGLYTYN